MEPKREPTSTQNMPCLKNDVENDPPETPGDAKRSPAGDTEGWPGSAISIYFFIRCQFDILLVCYPISEHVRYISLIDFLMNELEYCLKQIGT